MAQCEKIKKTTTFVITGTQTNAGRQKCMNMKDKLFKDSSSLVYLSCGYDLVILKGKNTFEKDTLSPVIAPLGVFSLCCPRDAF